MTRTLPPPTTFPADSEHALAVIEHLASGRERTKPFSPGRLEVVKLLHKRAAHNLHDRRSPVELVYAAKPASKASNIHSVHLVFQDGDQEIPAPSYEPEQDRIRLYYPAGQLDQILELLRKHRDRFCYFWQAADASRVRAWLFSPR